MKDKNMSKNSQLGFIPWQTMLANLTDFYDEMAGFVDEESVASL